MSDNLQEGRDFLTEKEGEDGVVALPSGLLYKVIEAGDGATPQASDSVTVHYRGTLIDGTVFDSSYDRGAPATFPVNRVIAGWVEALGQRAMICIRSSTNNCQTSLASVIL